jgi:nanoRNase/pAp phosphatase (c-di-AMP/oligoRNAs hydrolase)
MVSETPRQIFETIKRSSSPLLVLPYAASTDAHASALGFSKIISQLGKKPEIVSANKTSALNLKFLPGAEQIKSTLENLRQLNIEINTQQTRVQNIRHEEKDGKIFIALTPHQGAWNDGDIEIRHTAYRHDLIICLGAKNLEAFSDLYNNNKDFFFRTPIINIDHTTENEHFGHINHVNIAASAVGEVCFELVSGVNNNLIDEEIATAFLTGMIAKTRSFRTTHLHHRTLEVAGRLVSLGANRQKIVQNLFQTRSVGTLRLWGRALARLKSDPTIKIVWTLLSQQDFMHAGAQEEDLPEVIDELITSSPEAKIILLLYEDRQKNICGIIRTEPPLNAVNLITALSPIGHQEQAHLYFNQKTIVEAEQETLGQIYKTLRK